MGAQLGEVGLAPQVGHRRLHSEADLREGPERRGLLLDQIDLVDVFDREADALRDTAADVVTVLAPSVDRDQGRFDTSPQGTVEFAGRVDVRSGPLLGEYAPGRDHRVGFEGR